MCVYGIFISCFRHMRQTHCTQEGGSFVCHYGYNGVCSSLPLEGVSDRDYEDHVVKNHASAMYSKGEEITYKQNIETRS